MESQIQRTMRLLYASPDSGKLTSTPEKILKPVSLDPGAPNYPMFGEVVQAPSFNLSKRIAKPFAPSGQVEEMRMGFVPLKTDQWGSKEFAEPNVEGYKLKSETPMQSFNLQMALTEEVEPQHILAYDYQKGIRPEYRSLFAIP